MQGMNGCQPKLKPDECSLTHFHFFPLRFYICPRSVCVFIHIFLSLTTSPLTHTLPPCLLLLLFHFLFL